MKGDTHFISISHTLDGLQEGVDGFGDVTLKILIDQLLHLRPCVHSLVSKFVPVFPDFSLPFFKKCSSALSETIYNNKRVELKDVR